MLRDVVWTLIVVWLVYKISYWFRSLNQKKTAQQASRPFNQQNEPSSKKAGKEQPYDNVGEYVDFEELK